jgi:hypothetical protein
MGVLWHNDRIDIEALLNPYDELQMMETKNDEQRNMSGCVGCRECTGRRAHQWWG